MERVHIIGGKNHGKTTLIEELVRTFHAQGLHVGTIKHTHHQHELDTPGKDSHRHREAGAAVVGIYSPDMNALFWPPRPAPTPANAVVDHDLKYAEFAPMFDNCDLVLVEGDTRAKAPRLEVWRGALGTSPFAHTDKSIAAVITDDAPAMELGVPIWPRSDTATMAVSILKLIGDT